MGFPGGLVNTVGTPIVDSFSNIFFYILPHLSKTCSRNFKYPELFNCLLKDVETKEQTYNNQETHKNKARLSSDVLNVKLQGLYDIKINFSVTLSNPRYKKLNDVLDSLLKGVQGYLDNLKPSNERQKKIHQSLQPARSIDDGGSSQVRQIKASVRVEKEIEKYKELEEITKTVEPYHPVFINDVLPVNRKNRFDYITDIKLPYSVELYSYHPGARSLSLWFCWKSDGVDPCKINAVVHKIESSGTIPSFHTRAMRKEFMYRLSLVLLS